MRFLSILRRIFDGIVTVFFDAAGVLIIVIMCSVASEIILRYFLNRPQVWVVEIASYAMLYITFLGAAAVLRKEKQVILDFLVIRLKPRAQLILNCITSTISTIVCFVLFWYGSRVFMQFLISGQVADSAIGIPRSAVIVIIPLGSLLLGIQSLSRTYNFAVKIKQDLSTERDFQVHLTDEI